MVAGPGSNRPTTRTGSSGVNANPAAGSSDLVNG